MNKSFIISLLLLVSSPKSFASADHIAPFSADYILLALGIVPSIHMIQGLSDYFSGSSQTPDSETLELADTIEDHIAASLSVDSALTTPQSSSSPLIEIQMIEEQVEIIDIIIIEETEDTIIIEECDSDEYIEINGRRFDVSRSTQRERNRKKREAQAAAQNQIKIESSTGTLVLLVDASFVIPSSSSSIGATPQKKTLVSICTPIKKQIRIRSFVNGVPTPSIDSSTTHFTSGWIVFTNSLTPASSFAVNADHPDWSKIVDYFISSYEFQGNHEDFPALLAELSHFIHNNILKFDDLIVRDRTNDADFVCRHYAVISAIMLSKIMAKLLPSSSQFAVQVLTGNFINQNYDFMRGSHAWNLIRFVDNGVELHWFYDSQNFALACFRDGANTKFKDVAIVEFDSPNEIIRTSAPRRDFFCFFVKLTLERFFGYNRYRSLYSTRYLDRLDRVASRCIHMHDFHFPISSSQTSILPSGEVEVKNLEESKSDKK